MFRGDGITWMKRIGLFVLFFLGGFQALGQAPDPTQWADFGLYAKEAPRAPETDRIQRTQLPLALGDAMRVALIGNTLFERMGHYGFFESWIHSKYPEAQLVFRNLAWSADTVSLRPRPDNFADLEQHLFRVQADLILMAFGFNESFSGKQGLEAFERALHGVVVRTDVSGRGCGGVDHGGQVLDVEFVEVGQGDVRDCGGPKGLLGGGRRFLLSLHQLDDFLLFLLLLSGSRSTVRKV